MTSLPRKLPLALLTLLSFTRGAGALEAGDDAADKAGLWESTRSSVSGMWDRTMRAWQKEEGEDFGRLWERVTPRLDETLTLQERRATLPEKAWLGEDRASNRAAMEELMDESIGILSAAPRGTSRARIREIQNEILELQAEIAALQQRRVSAPRDSMWKKTVADYDEAIAERRGDIDARKRELAELRQRFAEELRGIGLSVSDDQLEFLLSTVVGDDLVAMTTAFDNVKQITEQLEQLMLKSENNLEAARRYYGMYTVLLGILERMHAQLLDQVDGEYLPGLDDIARRTEHLIEETQRLMGQSPRARETLATNLQAQQLTRQAAAEYARYLQAQRASVEQSRNRLRQDILVAENTYATVKVSGDLLALMNTSRNLLNTLLDLQIPALRAFDNLVMKREFEKLTEQLRGG